MCSARSSWPRRPNGASWLDARRPAEQTPSRRQPGFCRVLSRLAAPSGAACFALKRREDVRGSDVRRLCSCFRLLADSGRWRSDRGKRVRLRLSACVRSSSRPFLGPRVTGRQERRSNRKVGSSLAGSSELARRLKALRVVKAAALHGATGTAILAVRCSLTSWVRSAWRRSVRGEPHVQSPGRKSSRLSDAANRSVSRRREPRGASRPVGAKPRRKTISTEGTGTRL